MANGSRHSLLFVPEAVYGQTPVNPALQILRNTGTTLGLTKSSFESAEIRSDRMTAEMRMGANQVGGDINIELSCDTFDSMLQSVLLSQDWMADPADPNLEYIQVGQLRKSFTFVRHFEDLVGAGVKPYFIYRGVELNQLKLTVQANAMVKGSFAVVGQGQENAVDLTTLGTATQLPPTTTPQLDSFTGSLQEGGETIAVVTEIQLTLDNGIAPRFVVGQKNSILPSLGRAKVTGTMTAYFEDSALIDKFLNEENSSLKFSLPDGKGKALTFDIPNIKYTGGQPNVTNEGPITLSMPFTALIDPKKGTNLRISRNKPAVITAPTSPVNLTVGVTHSLTTDFTVSPAGTAMQFTSADTSKLSIVGSIASPKAAGDVVVTASVEGGVDKSVTYHIVAPVITAPQTPAALHVGGADVDLSTEFSIAPDAPITFSSSDTSIATIVNNNKLHPVLAGVVNVTATALGATPVVAHYTVAATAP